MSTLNNLFNKILGDKISIHKLHFYFFTILLILAGLATLDNRLFLAIIDSTNISTDSISSFTATYQSAIVNISFRYLLIESIIMLMLLIAAKTDCYFYEIRDIFEFLVTLFNYFILLVVFFTKLKFNPTNTIIIENHFDNLNIIFKFLIFITFWSNICILFMEIIGYFYKRKS